MAETMVAVELCDLERRGMDRRRAGMAARLLRCCLGIAAEPSLDVTASTAADRARKDEPLGDGLFKDVFDFGTADNGAELQLLVVDENGRLKAESKELYSAGQALELLEKLPLPLSPRAERWLKDCLGEAMHWPAMPAQVTRIVRN